MKKTVKVFTVVDADGDTIGETHADMTVAMYEADKRFIRSGVVFDVVPATLTYEVPAKAKRKGKS